MLDLHFGSFLVSKYSDIYQVTEDCGSDLSPTLTTLKLKLQTEFDLKAKFLIEPTKVSKQRESERSKP